MTTNIIRDIKDVAAAILGVPVTAIETDSDLRDMPGVESIKMLQIIAKLEKKYGIQLEDEIVFSVTTVSQMASAIEARLSTAAASP